MYIYKVLYRDGPRPYTKYMYNRSNTPLEVGTYKS